MAFWPDLPKMLALPTTVNLATFMVIMMMMREEMIESDAESSNEKSLTVMKKKDQYDSWVASAPGYEPK
jgi:hypothetical protein